jgi:tRNA (guanosine-2'-O-)-methyltransferase
LDKNGFVSVVTSPHVKDSTIENVTLEEYRWSKHKRLALWFGNESGGISQEAVQRAKRCVQIPMCGMVESLNLASCSAIVMAHVRAQRRLAKKKKKEKKDVAGS